MDPYAGWLCALGPPTPLQGVLRPIGCGGRDSNPRPSGYGPDELPDCSTPRYRIGRLAATSGQWLAFSASLTDLHFCLAGFRLGEVIAKIVSCRPSALLGRKRWTLLSTSEVWRFSRRGGLSLRLARTVSKDGNRYRILSDSPRHLASKPPKHLVRDKRFIPFRCFGIPDIDFSMSPSKSGIGCGGRI